MGECRCEGLIDDQPPLTDEELAAMKARADAATPGPWRTWRGDVGDRYEVIISQLLGSNGREVMHLSGGFGHPNADDTAFIAHARDDVPRLIAEVERLRQEKVDAAKGYPNDLSTLPPNERAAILLANIRKRGDEYGDVANSFGDLLRDALVLAARELNEAEVEVEWLRAECSLCGVPLSTGDCNHLLDLGDGRVAMKRTVWEGLVEDRLRLRAERPLTQDSTAAELGWVNQRIEELRGDPEYQRKVERIRAEVANGMFEGETITQAELEQLAAEERTL